MATENQDSKPTKSFSNSLTSKDLNDSNLLKEIISNCGGSIYIIQNNKIVFHNPQFTSLTGYNSKEIDKMEFTDLVHAKDKKLINLLFSNNFNEISQKTSRSYTFRAVHRSGQMRWFKSNVSIIEWEGQPALLDNCFDISQQKEFEQLIVEEEQNFRLLVNGFEDMVFIVSRSGAVVQANRSVYNRLGLGEHQVILKNFSSFYLDDKREEVRKFVSEAFFGKRTSFNGFLERQNNTIIPVETRVFKGNWSQKEVVFAICQDISARIESERIVKLSEEKFSKAFETNALMMTISSFHDGRYIDVNETFIRTTGLTKNQIIGKKSSELNIFVDIEHRDRLKKLILREGKARDIETTLINSKGEHIIVNLSTDLIDIQGEACLLVVMNDITERKRAEERIMQSEIRFRQLAELLPEKVFEADGKGNITFVNNYLSSLFNLDNKEINEGIHISTLFSPKSQKVIAEYLKQSKYKPELPTIELVAQKPDGSQFPALTHIFAVIERGKINRFMGIMVDITARKHQELELIKAKELAEEASKAKEQFLSTMSHEIRTPMNAVIGMANLILQENTDLNQQENLKTLKFSAEGLMALLNDILDFSKIEAGKLLINRYPIKLKSLTEGVCNVHKHVASKKGIDLIWDYDQNIPDLLLGDGVRINQILTNLTANAIKFTDKGKTVISLKLVKETKNTASVLFKVTDTGIGIAADKQKVIFQEFTQANIETTRKYGGTGLGLAISKKLVTMLKGKIEVVSQPGKGSEFFFTLNFNKTKNISKEENILDSILNIPKNKDRAIKILVVEDNEINSYIVIKFLKSWGIETQLAENGQIALDLINHSNFDLILMDLEMPVMSGYEASERIRSIPDPIKSKIPIIALTASAMLDVQTKIFSIGMNGFILKPFSPNDLKRKIIELLYAN
jgi:PAS domain S-box-containing protein